MAFSAHKTEEAVKERFDTPEELGRKLDQLTQWVKTSKHFVCFTGAGISTSAGIPDFRGPNGVWTLQAEGRRRTGPVTSTLQAIPTATHMSLVTLQRLGILKYLISQNCDGLHRRSGFDPNHLSELHGNSNIEECEQCERRYLRDFAAHRMVNRSRDHYTGRHCAVCKGRLLEWTIDFGQGLPMDQLERGSDNANAADLHMALGSSLTVSPACDLPAATGKKRGGRLVVVNLQHTPLDKLCALRIYARTDDVMKGLMERLAIPIHPWTLNRRLVFQYGAGRLDVAALDPFQSLPATLYKTVTLHLPSGEQRRVTSEPWTFHDVPSGNTTLTMEWQGHYSEPPLSLEVDLQPEKTVCRTARFMAMEGTWDVGDAQPATEQEAEAALVLRAPPAVKTITEGVGAGCWGQSVSVYIDGVLNIVLLGGTRHTITRITPRDGVAQRLGTTGDEPYVAKPRWGHVACSVHPTVATALLFGGWDSECQYNDLYSYDAATNSLQEIEVQGRARPSPRGCSAGCLLGRKFYIFGGACCQGGPYEYYNDLWCYDLVGQSWTHVEPGRGVQPSPRAQHTLTAVGKFLVLLGGCDASTVYDDMYLYDTTKNVWVTLDPHVSESGALVTQSLNSQEFRVPAMRHTASLVRTELVVWSAQGVSAYNIKDRRWRSPLVETPSPALACHSACIAANSVFVAGGVDPSTQKANSSLLEINV